MHRQARGAALVLAVAVVGACSGGTATPGAPSDLAPGSTAASTGPVPSGPQPLGDHLVAQIQVDNMPCALAFDKTSGWATSYREGMVDRFDVATDKVTAHVDIGGLPCGVALGPDGRIWVADLGGARVVAIDPVALKVTATIGSLSTALWDLKSGFGSIWVVDRTNQVLLRIDPASATIAKQIPIGPMGSGIAVTAKAVWVADALDGTIRRIDPATNTATVTATIKGGAIWFADDGQTRLGVGGTPGGPFTILDADSGAIRATIDGWLAIRDGTVIGSTAWIPDGNSADVILVDLDAARITATYSLPNTGNPFVAEVSGGDLFIEDFGGSLIWRVRP